MFLEASFDLRFIKNQKIMFEIYNLNFQVYMTGLPLPQASLKYFLKT